MGHRWRPQSLAGHSEHANTTSSTPTEDVTTTLSNHTTSPSTTTTPVSAPSHSGPHCQSPPKRVPRDMLGNSVGDILGNVVGIVQQDLRGSRLDSNNAPPLGQPPFCNATQAITTTPTNTTKPPPETSPRTVPTVKGTTSSNRPTSRTRNTPLTGTTPLTQTTHPQTLPALMPDPRPPLRPPHAALSAHVSNKPVASIQIPAANTTTFPKPVPKPHTLTSVVRTTVLPTPVRRLSDVNVHLQEVSQANTPATSLPPGQNSAAIMTTSPSGPTPSALPQFDSSNRPVDDASGFGTPTNTAAGTGNDQTDSTLTINSGASATNTSQKKSPYIKAVIGGCVAAAVFLALLLCVGAGFYFIRRRHRRKKRLYATIVKSPHPPHESHTSVGTAAPAYETISTVERNNVTPPRTRPPSRSDTQQVDQSRATSPSLEYVSTEAEASHEASRKHFEVHVTNDSSSSSYYSANPSPMPGSDRKSVMEAFPKPGQQPSADQSTNPFRRLGFIPNRMSWSKYTLNPPSLLLARPPDRTSSMQTGDSKESRISANGITASQIGIAL
ncbi:unnamed protein product [Cyclocybe aegerita]|uniref:Uncharacterized protein n=1 Tax=Cyclocybe aegerita TaxID=1973307 RepID=A0A8S0VS49_CYCAE|nr:unnamed protein product [Cyclocybe aegerita]